MGKREDAYDEHISPLMTRVIALCKEHGIPMAASFELDPHPDEENNPLMCTTILIDEEGPLRATSSKLIAAAKAMRPNQALSFATIISTDPETGDKRISIQKV